MRMIASKLLVIIVSSFPIFRASENPTVCFIIAYFLRIQIKNRKNRMILYDHRKKALPFFLCFAMVLS